MYKFTPFVDYNLWLKRLDDQPNEPTNQYSIKVPKVVRPTNKKRFHKTLGTSKINTPMSPPFLSVMSLIIMINVKPLFNSMINGPVYIKRPGTKHFYV